MPQDKKSTVYSADSKLNKNSIYLFMVYLTTMSMAQDYTEDW
jgi:hypothetical protein